MKKILTNLAVFAAFAVSASNVNVAEFPYRKTVEIPTENPRPAIFAIIADEDLYRHSEPYFPNLRIVTPDGKQVPYAVGIAPERWEIVPDYHAVSGRITDFSIDKTNNTAIIEYTLEESAEPIGQLKLTSHDADFDKKITLEFDDQSSVTDLKFFNHSKNLGFRNNTFTFAPRKARKVRIHIANFVEISTDAATLEHKGTQDSFTESRLITENFRLEEIIFYSVTPKLTAIPKILEMNFPEIQRQKKDNSTELCVQTNRRQLDAFVVHTATPEFRRKVVVQGFRRYGNSAVTALYEYTIEAANPVIPLKDFRADDWSITIENGDDPELAELSLSGRGKAEVLLIEGATAPAGTLSIVYGSEKSDVPEYGIRHYLHKFDGQVRQSLAASPEEPNPEYSRHLPTGGWNNFFKRAVVWIIAAAAIVLAAFAWKNFKKITPEKE